MHYAVSFPQFECPPFAVSYPPCYAIHASLLHAPTLPRSYVPLLNALWATRAHNPLMRVLVIGVSYVHEQRTRFEGASEASGLMPTYPIAVASVRVRSFIATYSRSSHRLSSSSHNDDIRDRTVPQFHACLLMRLMMTGHSTYGHFGRRRALDPGEYWCVLALCSSPSGDVDAMGHRHLLSLSASSPAKMAPRSSSARPSVTVQSKSKTPRHPSTPDSEILVSGSPVDPLERSPSLFAHSRGAGLEAIVAYR